MLVFEIPGIPVPQKQTKFVRSTGIAYDPSKKDKEAIQWQIKANAPDFPIKGGVDVYIYFGLPIPESYPKRVWVQIKAGIVPHVKKPDIDNLAYLVTNAMKGIVYEDDSQIVRLSLDKRYDVQPKTVIRIYPSTLIGGSHA